MGKHRGTAHELGKLGHGLAGRGRVRHVEVGDVRERLDVLWDWLPRVHERAERVDDLAAAQAGGGNLGQLALGERQTRRLGVEHHDIVLYQAKVLRASALGQRAVTSLDLLGRVGQQDLAQQVAWLRGLLDGI